MRLTFLDRLALLAASLALCGCQMGGLGGGLGGGGLGAALRANAPPPATGFGQGVSGLEVGHRLMASGEHELALKAYYRAAAEDGMSVDVLSAIGSANLGLGRLGQAEQMLRRAVDLDPRFIPAQNNLGVVLLERGKLAEAKRVFEQAFALDSGATDSIRENLRLVMAMMESPGYVADDTPLMIVPSATLPASSTAEPSPAVKAKPPSGYDVVPRRKDEVVLLEDL